MRQGVDRRRVAEVAGLLLAPAAAYFILRLRLMPMPDINDPAMHSTFIIDPQAIFTRFTAAFTPSARLREGARVGFLEPARVAYLLFGAVGGFVAFRYVLALVAIVPTYLLLRRLYGRAAGAVGVLVILSCPVIITAWGTDFPDSATVSYLIGGIACLAMPTRGSRIGWLIGAAVLLTLALWAFAASGPLLLATAAAYLLVRMLRERPHLLRDIGVVVGTAVVVTCLLVGGSKLLLGPSDFISTTLASITYLNQPALEAIYHSTNWHWAPYLAYLLVPPAVILIWVIAFARRLRAVPTPQLFIGVTCLIQLVVDILLQFVGKVQMLEEHYFSSLLWAIVSLTFTVSFVELCRPLLARSLARWLLPLSFVAVALAYEAYPHVPAFDWKPWGFLVVLLAALLALLAHVLMTHRRSSLQGLAGAAALILVNGCLLVLTVAPSPPHAPLPDTTYDPAPAYASALGGQSAVAVDLYRVTTELPAFVGDPTYSGEQLVMWWPWLEYWPHTHNLGLIEPIGIYHAFFNSIPGTFGSLDAEGRHFVETDSPAQVLLLNLSGARFARCLHSLSAFQPHLVRTGVLSSGPIHLHVWLIDLGRYLRAPAS